MTSGEFRSVPIDSIFVDRDKRQRREITNVEELADSIRRNGLINPPTITREGELIAGERRWTACRSLGWTHIPIQYIDDLNEYERQAIELEENIKRTDLTWQEECGAILRYYELRKGEPGWNLETTASALGVSFGKVQSAVQIAREIESGNERVIAAPKLSVARGIVERTLARRKESTAAKIDAEIGGDEPDAPVEEDEADEVPLIHADFIEWQREYAGPKFNLIHCDFPYGVKADKHNQGAAAAFGGYADDPDVYWQLLATLERAMENVVADSAHLIFWFSMDYYQRTLDALSAMGWSVNPFPLIWHKSDNTGILPDPHRGPRRIYETAFFASRGDRKIVGAVGNCFAAPVTKTVHMSEKARPMLHHFLRMTVDEYSHVLDPTAGSGNALKEAQRLGASRVLGLEKSEEFYTVAKESWND